MALPALGVVLPATVLPSVWPVEIVVVTNGIDQLLASPLVETLAEENGDLPVRPPRANLSIRDLDLLPGTLPPHLKVSAVLLPRATIFFLPPTSPWRPRPAV